METKKREDLTRRRNGTSKRVLLIGAGDAGNMVAKELSQRADLGMQVAGFVDVTGAGGSIGSELCRQLYTYWPKELILIDKDENSIFEIDKERDKVTQFEKIFVTPPVEYQNGDRGKRLEDMVAVAEKGQDAEIIRHFQEMGIGYQGDWRGGGR